MSLADRGRPKYATEEERRAARRAAQVAFRERHPERVRAHNAAWAEANPDKVRAKGHAYRSANRDRLIVAKRERYAANREVINAQNLVWKKANPDKAREYVANRRARLQGAGGRLTAKEWREILEVFGHACAYCGTQDAPLEQEHMLPISRGGRHDRANVIPACRGCNCRKHAKTPFEFLGVPFIHEASLLTTATIDANGCRTP